MADFSRIENIPTSTNSKPRELPKEAESQLVPKASFQCQVCKNSYDRPDHMQRHYRTHNNVRQFRCDICSQSFTRRDLLTRHRRKHERDAQASERNPGARHGRVGKACQNCVVTKSRCGEEKPCMRCVRKGLQCVVPYGTKDHSDSASRDASLPNADHEIPRTQLQISDLSGLMQQEGIVNSQIPAFTTFQPGMSSTFHYPFYGDAGMSSILTDLDADGFITSYNNSGQYYSQFHHNLAFESGDINFDLFDIFSGNPDLGVTGSLNPSLDLEDFAHERLTPRTIEVLDRSPFLWKPNSQDAEVPENSAYAVNEDNPETSPRTIEQIISGGSNAGITPLNDGRRDALLVMVSKITKSEFRSGSFPSTALFNILVRAFFIRESYRIDTWMHAASFHPPSTQTELLGAVIAAGATLLVVPALWKMGHAMQETVRIALYEYIENDNRSVRDLEVQQAFMMWIELGLWSGDPRKIEFSEAAGQAITTMVLRSGAFSHRYYSIHEPPTVEDDADQLRTKWLTWAAQESRKRLAIHVFLHQIRASIAFLQNPHISLSDISLPLPASRDLWLAQSAEEWRTRYLLRQTPNPHHPDGFHPPNISYTSHYLATTSPYIDTQLGTLLILSSYYTQICAYHSLCAFHLAPGPTPVWLTLQYQELYLDLQSFPTRFSAHITSGSHEILFLHSLLSMLLQIPMAKLQRLAGRMGEHEAERTYDALCAGWATSIEARRAAWHAGQVLANAKRCWPQTHLSGFLALAVYQATLVLWGYGFVGLPAPEPTAGHEPVTGGGPSAENVQTQVRLDEAETAETRAFVNLGYGSAGITSVSATDGTATAVQPRVGEGFVSLQDLPGVMRAGAEILKENYRSGGGEPRCLPPLVESLLGLMNQVAARRRPER